MYIKKLLAKQFTKHNYLIFVLIVTILGGFLRFYKLDWGNGFFFHPDEYHIIIAVDRLHYPQQMDPELFSYGSFTVYIIYFTKILLNLSASSFLIGRFYSALFSTLTIPLVFLISKQLFKDGKLAVLSSFLAALLPGLIQQAHFATPESALTFWLMCVLYFLLLAVQSDRSKHFFTAAASLGLAMGVKITAALYMPLILVAPFFSLTKTKSFPKLITKKLSFSILLLTTTALFFFIVFPYAALDLNGMQNSMRYETSVGRGTMLVFYTRQFINTIPIFFQLKKILPYSLGPAILFFGLIGLLLMTISLFVNIKRFNEISFKKMFLVVCAFCLFFFPNAILFAKWTRFIAPTLPFFVIFTVYLFDKLYSSTRSKITIIAVRTFFYLVILTTAIWCLMFFSIYTKKDVRVQADNWLSKNIPSGSFILTESGNMLEVPLAGNLQKKSFEFYQLDEDHNLQIQLPQYLEKADYFVVQSRRIFADHQSHPNLFPVTSNFYNNLFSGRLGFEEIKEFTSYPSLAIGKDRVEVRDESAEETWSVFDHPVIRIYKKVLPLQQTDYEKVLKI